MGEGRMTQSEIDSPGGRGHKVRYRLASGFVDENSTVLDAACGIGYGADFFTQRGAEYWGVDQHEIDPIEKMHDQKRFLVADLNSWRPSFRFDVGVSFETIEHLEDYQNLISVLKEAKEWIICSVPVIKTTHFNQWHKHDFEPGELVDYFVDENWHLYQKLGQPSEYSEIYIFERSR